MARDFYSTMAQVLPVLLLALVWESRYLENLPNEQRRLRRDDPVNGVLFWTKPRVRVYAISVATIVLAETGVCVLVLAGTIPDTLVLRGVVVAGLLLTLVSLLVRIWFQILRATEP
ncbi:hypothetical protein [Actinomadura sp. HBU206391]|uniref:hypothetical protein n=1 Tax=Actinomadura sp. HBU206391 TaxID=2731692 RepID=UPI00164F7604|nr:hypothetical protein [Actinomadura sp. HBU206391]MBC6458514.1 hypothetical protein [Actinomadura sp. HBU206391]